MKRWAREWLHSMLVTGLLMGMMMGRSLFLPISASTSSVNRRPTPDSPTCPPGTGGFDETRPE